MFRSFVASITLLLAPIGALANPTLCNVSQTHSVHLAMALSGAGPGFRTLGWFDLPPQECMDVVKPAGIGDLHLLFHMVSEGIILTRGETTDLVDDTRRFCVSTSGFDRTDVLPLDAAGCEAGFYPAVFPIRYVHRAGDGPIKLNFDPDPFVAANRDSGGVRDAGGHRLPDQHGALARSSSGVVHVSAGYLTAIEARDAAAQACQAREPGTPCQIEFDFKNQCIALVEGGREDFVALALSADEAVALASARCEATGADCRVLLRTCPHLHSVLDRQQPPER